MEYKEAITEAKRLINEGVTGLRGTYLSAAIAHSRGRMHFQRAGHWWAYEPKSAAAQCNVYAVPQGKEGLEWQSKTMRENLKRVAWTHSANELNKERERPYRYTEVLSKEELSMVVFLLDAGDVRHLRGDGEEGGVDLPRAQNAVGM